MIEKLGRRAWADLSRKVASDLAPVFAVGETQLGATGRRLASKALPKLSLSSSRSVQDMANVIVLLDTAGAVTQAEQAANHLRQVPFTGDQTIFEPIRQTFALMFRRATLGDLPSAGSFEPLLCYAENGGEPGPPVIRDSTRRRLDGMLVRQYWRDDMSSGSPAAHVANICADIRELATMWALGGSDTWPRPRIDDAVADATDALRNLDAVP